MEQTQRRDARDGRDAPSIDPMESFDTLYRKVSHCSSRASLESYEQCEIPRLAAVLTKKIRGEIDVFRHLAGSNVSSMQGALR